MVERVFGVVVGGGQGVDLKGGIDKAAQLVESEGIESEVDEVFVRLGKERSHAGAGDFIEDRTPLPASSEVEEGGDVWSEIAG